MLNCDLRTKERAAEIKMPDSAWIEEIIARLQKKAGQGKNVFIRVDWDGGQKLYACEVANLDYDEAVAFGYKKVTGYTNKKDFLNSIENDKNSFAWRYGL